MSLKAYLANRRAEIEAEQKRLRAELAEIKVAEAALGGGAPGRADEEPKAAKRGGVREGTIKHWVLQALFIGPEKGMTTEDIISAIMLIDGPEVPRNSMTPQLSRLKDAGFVHLQGRYWVLDERAAAELRAELSDLPPDGPPEGWIEPNWEDEPIA